MKVCARTYEVDPVTGKDHYGDVEEIELEDDGLDLHDVESAIKDHVTGFVSSLESLLQDDGWSFADCPSLHIWFESPEDHL